MATDFPYHYYFSIEKRLFDLISSLLLLVALSPTLLLIGILIKIGSKGPVLYKQKRIGLNGIVFSILKFRTMYDGAEKDRDKYLSLNTSPHPTFKIINDPRFVGIGNWLSHSCLDELPQLLNVLKGEMSLIGPRPFPVAEAERLPSKWNFRSRVKPGILSSWAVSNRRHMTLDKWIRLDQDDLRHGNLIGDIKLIITAALRMI